MKQVQTLTRQPFYQRGINAGVEEDHPDEEEPTKLSKDCVASEFKRNAVYSMTVPEFYELIRKIESVHALICKDIRESYKIPEACGIWIKREVDRYINFGIFIFIFSLYVYNFIGNCLIMLKLSCCFAANCHFKRNMLCNRRQFLGTWKNSVY